MAPPPWKSCKTSQLGSNAAGYWGGNPRTRIAADQTADKVLGLHFDKISAMGLPYALWQEATSVFTNPTLCSCFKDTSKQPDIPCLSCYGTGYLPGYIKFGTRNYWASSIDNTWTLSNVVLDKNNRPFRLMLTAGATSGTATTPDLAMTAVGKLGAWEYDVAGFTRDGGASSSILAEFSPNAGANWYAMSQLETVLPTSIIRFRITLSRTTAADKSPVFEMIRVRFPIILDAFGPLLEPVIRFIPTWDVEQEIRNNYGSNVDASGKNFWTLPLNFFDAALLPDTAESRIIDDAFVECRYGGMIGFRYAMNQFKYSDTFGKMTHQAFVLRKVAGKPNKLVGEHFYRVF